MTEEMNVPYEFHRDIIGKGGSNIRKLMDEFDVNISVPPSQDHSEEVKIHGPPSNVARAIEGMKDKVAELEREKEERVCQPLVQLVKKVVGFAVSFQTFVAPVVCIAICDSIICG